MMGVGTSAAVVLLTTFMIALLSGPFQLAAAAAPAPPSPLVCSPGALNGAGELLRIANLTVTAATAWCAQTPSCGGFTAKMNKTCSDRKIHLIYFKTATSDANTDPLWSMYRKPNFTAPLYFCSSSNS